MRGSVAVAAVFAVIAGAGLAAGATPAHADDADNEFIDVIRSEGIPYTNEENAVSLASAVCDSMVAGVAPGQVAVEIMGTAGWTASQSHDFVGQAERSYCP